MCSFPGVISTGPFSCCPLWVNYKCSKWNKPGNVFIAALSLWLVLFVDNLVIIINYNNQCNISILCSKEYIHLSPPLQPRHDRSIYSPPPFLPTGGRIQLIPVMARRKGNHFPLPQNLVTKIKENVFLKCYPLWLTDSFTKPLAHGFVAGYFLYPIKFFKTSVSCHSDWLQK